MVRHLDFSRQRNQPSARPAHRRFHHRAYYPEVEKHLEGKAYVGRLSSSAFISDPVLLKQIEMVLGQYKFDVIHFNNGMHGWQHSEKEYEQAFPKFLKAIKKYAPDAN